MRTLSTNGKNKAKFSKYWDSGLTLHAGPSLTFDHSFTSDLSESLCFARGALGITLPFMEQGQSQLVPKQESLDGGGWVNDSY